MGCDIHMMVEKRSGDVWELAVVTYECGACEATGRNGGRECWACSGTGARSEYDSRFYDLFATLAGVRNYEGKVAPLAAPRGVPENACAEWKAEVAHWGPDFHSESWLLISEVLPTRDSFDKHWQRFLDACAALDADHSRVRLVFAFDN